MTDNEIIRRWSVAQPTERVVRIVLRLSKLIAQNAVKF